MAIFTRSIKNLSAVETLPVFIPGYDDSFSVSIAPMATLDLLTVVFAEQLHCMQAELNAMVADGAISVVGTIFSDALFDTASYGPISAPDTMVVFNPTTGSALHGTGVSSALQVESALSAIDTNDNETMITIA